MIRYLFSAIGFSTRWQWLVLVQKSERDSHIQKQKQYTKP